MTNEQNVENEILQVAISGITSVNLLMIIKNVWLTMQIKHCLTVFYRVYLPQLGLENNVFVPTRLMLCSQYPLCTFK